MTTKAAHAAAIRAEEAHRRAAEIAQRLEALRQLRDGDSAGGDPADARSWFETAQASASLARDHACDAAERSAIAHERAASRYAALGETEHAAHHGRQAIAARRQIAAHAIASDRAD